jgi:hypothetical protein
MSFCPFARVDAFHVIIQDLYRIYRQTAQHRMEMGNSCFIVDHFACSYFPMSIIIFTIVVAFRPNWIHLNLEDRLYRYIQSP